MRTGVKFAFVLGVIINILWLSVAEKLLLKRADEDVTDIGTPTLEAECGQVVVADSNKALISYSTPTFYGEFPWHVAIFKITQQGRTRSETYLCGGTLLNRDTVLTSAVCVTNFDGEVNQPSGYIVKLGLFNLDGTESMIQTKSVFQNIKHELYNASSYDSDIAIIKLNGPVEYNSYVRPVCLIDNIRAFNLQEGVVAGWGFDESNEIPNSQRKGTLIITSRNDCFKKSSDAIKEILTEANYCAASKDGQNVCKGDSGSGMVTELGNRWYVRGVASFGTVVNGYCDTNNFSIFTNTTYFYDWIVTKMG